jgi:plastocyanin
MWKVLGIVVALAVAAGWAQSAAPDKGKAKNRVDVAIKDRQYSPSSVTIKKGQTVVWTNYDDIDHTVQASDGSFDSGTIKKDGTFEHLFILPGKYAYLCKLHPRMKGTITVE